MLGVVEFAAVMGNRQHQEKRKDRISDLSKNKQIKAPLGVLFLWANQMQVQIQFLTGGANSLIGGFCAGDTARVSSELAKHLVEELGVAKYETSQPAELAKTPAKAKK